MPAAPTRNESRSLSLEYAPRSPSPNAPAFPVAITTETGIPVSGLGTPEIVHAPSPQLAPASPLSSSPPPLPVPPRATDNDSYRHPVASPYHIRVIEASHLAAAVAAETRVDSALHSAHPPLSPRSVANILQGHTDIPTGDLRSIIMGLVSAIDARNEGHHIQVHDLEDQVASLVQKHYLQPIDPDNIPPSFIENDGRVPQFLIPVHDDLELPAAYVCPLDTLNYMKAAGITGKLGPEEQEYIKEIFATPGVFSLPVSPTPTWFLRAIQAGSKRTYEDLRAEAIAFDNWGIITDLHRYHEDNEKLTHLNHLREQLVLECDGLCEAKALALARLEAAHVPLHLSHARSLYANSTSPPHSPTVCAHTRVTPTTDGRRTPFMVMVAHSSERVMSPALGT